MPSDHTQQKKTFRNSYVLWSFVATGLLLAVLVLLTVAGRSGRGSGPLPAKRVVIINNPEDTYRRWQGDGQRGRVVIAASRWLNFVDINSSLIIPIRNPQPLRVTNLAKGAEAQLSAKNFLNIAVLNGVAREIIHVVPEAEYPDRLAAVRAVEGAIARADDILVPHFGTPRRISTFKGFKVPAEPVLLYLNASFFKYHQPEELLEKLKKTGLQIDETVLCLSSDDSEVTAEERARLRRFAELAGGGI